MASFIYIYSKFTEEFLLLSSAGMFFLLALYCYHWVVKIRRLGAARNQIPAGMVKVYLNQLIDEAQFVRTQLFGLLGGELGPKDVTKLQTSAFQFQTASAPSAIETTSEGEAAAIPGDLLERLKALEGQLAAKESMVVNVNVEKTKLLEEIENLKQNHSAAAAGAAATPGAGNELVDKVKALEERLEEYALFEDDLANLKRLQQENASLKKRLEQAGSSGGDAAPSNEPAVEVPPAAQPKLEEVQSAKAPEPAAAPATSDIAALDQSAIDALLEGATPVSPEPTPAPAPEMVEAAPPQPAVEPASGDSFEKLVDSVETSLTPNEPSPPPLAVNVSADAATPAAEPKKDDVAGSKTDEELLKEFESLLNS